MSDRIKEITVKTIIVIAFGALLFVVPGAFVYCWFFNENTVNTLINTGLIVFGVFGVLLAVLIPIFGLKQKSVKAEKIALPVDDYEALSNRIRDSAYKCNYELQPAVSFNANCLLTMYIKQNGLWQVNCIALIHVAEINEVILRAANDVITESLKAYYGKERISDTINMITIVSVDRITPEFRKFVNGSIKQGYKNSRLPVGISFGGKSIYIAKQKDGFAITKYKKLREEFLKILQIQG